MQSEQLIPTEHITANVPGPSDINNVRPDRSGWVVAVPTGDDMSPTLTIRLAPSGEFKTVSAFSLA